MRIEIAFQIFMIIIAIACIQSKRIFVSILYMSALSIFSAALYVIYRAPDVALAEIVIGSALIPLIFLISILKARIFKVECHADDNFIANDSECFQILNDLCKQYNLELQITTKYHIDSSITDVFRAGNVDLIITENSEDNLYVFRGAKSSMIISKLNSILENRASFNYKLERLEDLETYE